MIESADFPNLRRIRFACVKIVDGCYVVDKNDCRSIRPRIISNCNEDSNSFKKMDLGFPRTKQRPDRSWELRAPPKVLIRECPENTQTTFTFSICVND